MEFSEANAKINLIKTNTLRYPGALNPTGDQESYRDRNMNMFNYNDKYYAIFSTLYGSNCYGVAHPIIDVEIWGSSDCVEWSIEKQINVPLTSVNTQVGGATPIVEKDILDNDGLLHIVITYSSRAFAYYIQVDMNTLETMIIQNLRNNDYEDIIAELYPMCMHVISHNNEKYLILGREHPDQLPPVGRVYYIYKITGSGLQVQQIIPITVGPSNMRFATIYNSLDFHIFGPNNGNIYLFRGTFAGGNYTIQQIGIIPVLPPATGVAETLMSIGIAETSNASVCFCSRLGNASSPTMANMLIVYNDDSYEILYDPSYAKYHTGEINFTSAGAFLTHKGDTLYVGHEYEPDRQPEVPIYHYMSLQSVKNYTWNPITIGKYLFRHGRYYVILAVPRSITGKFFAGLSYGDSYPTL